MDLPAFEHLPGSKKLLEDASTISAFQAKKD